MSSVIASSDFASAATADIAAPVESIVPSRESKTGFTRNALFWTREGPMSISDENNLGRVFEIWNGEEYVAGMPKKANLTHDLIRIVTDESHVIDCMPDQEFILADGSRKRADKLMLDDKLARSLMPTYPGDEAKEQLQAFFIGSIYGACLAGAPGSGKIDDALVFQIPFFTVDQKITKPDPDTGKRIVIDNPHLLTFGYDYKKAVAFAKENNLGSIDHDQSALIIVPEGLQKATTIPNAPLKDRIMWCAGLGMTSQRYKNITTARANVEAAVGMINSTGHKYEVKARVYDSEGRWNIEPICLKEDDPERATMYPKVASVSRIKTKNTSTIYTIDGIANGQVMINRLLVPITKNRPVDPSDKNVVFERNGTVVEFD